VGSWAISERRIAESAKTARQAVEGPKHSVLTRALRIKHVERRHAIALVSDAGFNPLKDECQLIEAQLVFHCLLHSGEKRQTEPPGSLSLALGHWTGWLVRRQVLFDSLRFS
jgi:hypothetical protein